MTYDQRGIRVIYRVYRVAVDNDPNTLGETISKQSNCVIRLLAELGDIEPCPRKQWHCWHMECYERTKSLFPSAVSILAYASDSETMAILQPEGRGVFANLQGLTTRALLGD